MGKVTEQKKPAERWDMRWIEGAGVGADHAADGHLVRRDAITVLSAPPRYAGEGRYPRPVSRTRVGASDRSAPTSPRRSFDPGTQYLARLCRARDPVGCNKSCEALSTEGILKDLVRFAPRLGSATVPVCHRRSRWCGQSGSSQAASTQENPDAESYHGTGRPRVLGS
jgi:hypothetical protein